MLRNMLVGLSILVLSYWVSVATGTEVVLDFNDGLLPSAHGWIFQGQDQNRQPLSETQVASVSGGILQLDTTPFGGIGSNETVGFWHIPVSVDLANFVIELRMRAIQPDGVRSSCQGLVGASLVVGNFGVSLMPSQLSVFGMSVPGGTCGDEAYIAADGSSFHTYRVEVRDNTHVTVLVDNVQVAEGVLVVTIAPPEAFLGDSSPSGGNVTAEIDFIRVSDQLGYRLPFVGFTCITNGPTCGSTKKTKHEGFDQEAIDFGLVIGTRVYAAEEGPNPTLKP